MSSYRKINNLGQYEDVPSFLDVHPESGHEGDYFTIETDPNVTFCWDKYDRTWEEEHIETESRNEGSQTIDGSLSVSENLHVGGVIFAEDMTQFCGLFGSEDELNTVRPNPKKGDLALVWTPNGISMYRCESDGSYTDTGQYSESPYLKYSNGQRVFGLSNDDVIFYAKDGSIIAEINTDNEDPELSIGTGPTGKLDEVRINVKELVEMTADNFWIKGNRPPATLSSGPEYALGFLADEITILKDLNNQTISLADYVGGRIDGRVGSYRAVVVTQSTGLTVFEADFSQHELKIILAEPNASTIVSALTILEPDVPAGFAFVRHLIIRNEGNYTINFPSVILGKEINIEAGQKLDASYLFYRSGSTVTYDLTFNVV